jgi:hypothetical protein
MFENKVIRKILGPKKYKISEQSTTRNFVIYIGGAGNFSPHNCARTGSGTHPASYTVGTTGCFLGVKRPGREADHSPPSSVEVQE